MATQEVTQTDHRKRPVKPVSLYLGDKAITLCGCDDCCERRTNYFLSRLPLIKNLDSRDKEDTDD